MSGFLGGDGFLQTDADSRFGTLYATQISLGASGGAVLSENTGFVVSAGFIANTASLGIRLVSGIEITAAGGICNLNAVPGSGQEFRLQSNGTTRIAGNSTGLGFFAATPVAKPTVTGSRGGNAALANLLAELALLGLITDSSTA